MAKKQTANEQTPEVQTTEVQAAEVQAAEERSQMKKIYIRRPAGMLSDKGKIVGLNGKMYSVPYDKEVEVPEGVYEILKNSERAQERAYELERELAGGGEIVG